LLSLAGVLLAACSGDPPGTFNTACGITAWAPTSAFGVYHSYAARFACPATFDPKCPSSTVNGNTCVLHGGGCSDTDGNVYTGTLTVTRTPGTLEESIVADHWTVQEQTTCGGTVNAQQIADGSLKSTVRADGTVAFVIDMEWDGVGPDIPADEDCGRTYNGHDSYSGTVVASGPDKDGDGIPDHTVWNGSGHLGKTVKYDATDSGWVDASTSNEVYDSSTCASGALSGATTIRAGSHQGVISYSGGGACTGATWSYDGKAQGSLSTVTD
jgi:hypothetical protein